MELIYRLFLLSPSRVKGNLRRVAHVCPGNKPPSLWQLCMGVGRMYHRMLTRPDSIGTSNTSPVRATWRARMLKWRPLRFPFLLREGAVAPWDMSGMLSSPERIMRHLLAAHHDRNQFVYDIQILGAYGCIEELYRRVQQQVLATDRRSDWLRDLCVYEGYHQDLLTAVKRARAGDFGLSSAESRDPDVSFYAYLNWCCGQPATFQESVARFMGRERKAKEAGR